MLFNSYIFIFLFLPVTFFGFYWIGRLGYRQAAIAWLVWASLVFYGWWNPVYLWLILSSILFNFTLGRVFNDKKLRNKPNAKKALCVFGVFINLALLAYYKYANFFVDSLNHFAGVNLHLDKIVLPLAISFFTFQQITFIVDAYRGETHEYNFLQYCLFVTFFPQLIAGPIVYHKEMLPQFARSNISKWNSKNISVGLSIFFIGLFKKVVIADGVAVFSTPVFDAAQRGFELTFFDSWGGVLAYTFQLYFDFSGYSDMAIGLGRLFGIKIPLNFHSPYKAVNIIDFWHRWHMTLSRVLRNYLYFSLGGNRKGKIRRYINLMIVMLLGGLWHGAGWTFVVWGALHGIYLVINNSWRSFRKMLGQDLGKVTLLGHFFSRGLTFFVVVIGWVFFRAPNVSAAFDMLKAMFGFNGFVLGLNSLNLLNKLGGLGNKLIQGGWQFKHMQYFNTKEQVILYIFLLFVVWCWPNTQEMLARYNPGINIYCKGEMARLPKWMQWRPILVWSIIIGIMTVWSIGQLSGATEFLYFQF